MKKKLTVRKEYFMEFGQKFAFIQKENKPMCLTYNT